MSKNKRKGDLLEELVALLHEIPGVDVQRKVNVPVVPANGSEAREIDVLLKGSLAGHPLQIAIECKNWKDPVGVEIVDAFFGKLAQVGIPVGIIVSANGYTEPARRRAEQARIRLLDFEGLTPDRLDQIVHEAFQTIIYVTLTWVRLSTFPFMPDDKEVPFPGAFDIRSKRDNNEPIEQWALRAVWGEWRDGRIPLKIGEHVAIVREPKDGTATTSEVIVDLVTHGHVFTSYGEARISTLRDANTKTVHRARLDIRFRPEDRRASIGRMTTEADVEEYARTGPVHVLHGRVRVPRMEMQGAWFPPSRRALIRLQELRAAGEEATLEKVEGLDLARAWDEPLNREDLEP